MYAVNNSVTLAPPQCEIDSDVTNKTKYEVTQLCEVQAVTLSLEPMARFVRFLLSYGTSFIIMLGLVLNGISLFILTRVHMRKLAPNTYLAALAVYDSLVLVLNLMIGVLRGNNLSINATFQQSEALCILQSINVELWSLLSVWIMIAFTVERFLMVKFPLKFSSPSVQRTRLVVLAVSATAVLFSMQKLGVSGFEGDSVFGYKACRTQRLISRDIIFFAVAFNTWLPVVLLCSLNLIITLEIRKNSKKRAEMMQGKASGKADDKATKLLMIVSLAFITLVLPLGILQTTELIWNNTAKVSLGNPYYVTFMTVKMRLKWARAFFFFFYQFNFAINFFLYVSPASGGSRFRATLKKVLMPCRRLNQDEISWTQTQQINSVAPLQEAPPSGSAMPPAVELPAAETKNDNQTDA